MPKIKIDHIVSFSSEDPVHTANNILSTDTTKKWKCRTVGERNAVVVLQLEKASVITGIDIGNEHSAYIEVLVSRSGTNDDFKVLLVTSAFMTPLEARQSQNINKVRMFQKEDFSKPDCDEKWDRVKVVCTQPFNRHIQYGLSFINLHTNEEKNAVSVQSHIGKFILRPESPDTLSAGSLFEKRKELKKEEKLTGAAAIREASSSSSLALYGSPVCKPKLKTKNSRSSVKELSADSSTPPQSRPRNRDELLYSKDEEEPHEKIDKIIDMKAKEQKADEENTPKKKVADPSTTSSKRAKRENSVQSPKPLDVSITGARTSDNDRKRRHKDEIRKIHKKPKNEKATKPFSKLLEGVTLVISGIQNPDRANLRASALSMGAKYKPDWNESCTHLICAFPNTPKFQQVRGKGKIVKKTWIQDCHSQRKRLPWRRYALDKNDIGQHESEEEICEEEALDSVQGNSDEEMDVDEHRDEGSDTEERIARIKESQKNKKKGKLHQYNVYIADTDEESPLAKAPSSPYTKLRNLYNSKKFYIDQSLDNDTYNKLQKYIAAYNGKSIDDPTANVDIIVTERGTSKTLREVNPDATCLSPDWVWDCHNSQKLVPMDDYIF